MSIKVTLEDNSIQQLPLEFINLSNVFKEGEVIHIHTSLTIFQRIKEFGEYYLSLSKKDKNMFENVPQIYDKDNLIQDWCEKFTNNIDGNLIELTHQSDLLSIIPLENFCCYKIAQLIQDKSISEMRQILKVENDFSPEEEEVVKRESDWINQN